MTKFGPLIKILYVPHGPLLNWQNRSLVQKTFDLLKNYSSLHKAIYIKSDPQFVVARGLESDVQNRNDTSFNLQEDLTTSGWKYSNQQIQFKNSFWIDLSLSEEDLLARMKQKTRYNIRLSQKKGVIVRSGNIADLELVYAMYAATSLRDGFIIRPKEYYFFLWQTFMEAGMALPLIAEVDNKPIGGLFLFYFNQKAYYLYGMSLDTHREMMPNYLLQWEAMRLGKSLGCKIYDLWGAPDIFDPSDRMWGVYKFKEGLGGEVIKTIGAYDYPTSKLAYTIIQEALPKFQSISRIIRGRQIRDEIAG